MTLLTLSPLFEHPQWPLLLSYLYLRKGIKGVNGRRRRIEVNKNAPASVFEIEVACCACGKAVKSVRVDEWGAWTFNSTCPLEVNVACSRSRASHQQADAVRKAMETAPPPVGSLFGE